jgi:2-polyprenyl-6-methoxyphenol hydroxylase-like FAD-dependent oxidoreductase
VEAWYATALFQTDSSMPLREFWLVFPAYPDTKGAIVAPLLGDRCYVSVSGSALDQPVASHDDLRRHLDCLEGRLPQGLLERARLVREPRLFRRPDAILRRFDLCPTSLPGYFPIGDAIAGLNPLLGQGMTVAARQAAELSAVFEEAAASGADLVQCVDMYARRAVSIALNAWNLGAIGRTDPRSTQTTLHSCAARRLKQLADMAQDDVAWHKRYVEYWHMLRPVSELMTP